MANTQRDDVVSTPAAESSGIADPGTARTRGLRRHDALPVRRQHQHAGRRGHRRRARAWRCSTAVSANCWQACGSSREGNTFGAVAFTSFGAFWLSYWFLVDHVVAGLKDAKALDIHHALGLYLLVWAIFTAYMTIAATRVVRRGLGRLRGADADVRRADHRRIRGRSDRGRPERLDQAGWLARDHHRRARLVRLVGRRHERDRQARRVPDVPALGSSV